jgi:hypothetical protein
VTFLGRNHLAGGTRWVTTFENRQDDLRAGVLPAWIVDGDQMCVSADPEPMEHLPRGIEQRVMRVRRRHGYLFRLMADAPPPLLRANQMRVRGTPASAALAFLFGVRLAPGPKVIGGSPP